MFEEPRFQGGGELGPLVQHGHPNEVGIVAHLFQPEHLERLGGLVKDIVEIVDDQGGQRAVRVVVKERFSEYPDLRQSVAGDDRAGVHGHGSASIWAGLDQARLPKS